MTCCGWPVADISGCCDDTSNVDNKLAASASERAGVILTTLSGGRAGTTCVTIRPIGECCEGRCRCSGAGDRIRVTSPLGQVTSVTSVTVDGEDVPASDWRFYPSTQLLYRVPDGVWPRRDRKWADCGQPDTMCVEAVVGYEPDAWALAVHQELTCELVKACTDQACRLPSNATAVTAQGVSVTLTPTEAQQFIPAVAGWVAAVNPNQGQNPARLFSPDTAMRGGGGCGC